MEQIQDTSFSNRRSNQLLEHGLLLVKSKRYDEARREFKLSAELKPTAEAYTYWGWMENKQGHLQEAINLCCKAIKLDPEFGNPYNDIGSYLLANGQFDKAKYWLKKAMKAKRYGPRQFPHINLGRIYLAEKKYGLALEQFLKAKEIDPKNEDVKKAIELLNEYLS